MSKKRLKIGQTIGIVGGGQLGKMMAIVAKYMGFQVVVLDPTEHSPASQVADQQIVAEYDDQEALDYLAQLSDVITYEFENVDVTTLTKIKDQVEIPQGIELLEITQDRAHEKAFLDQNEISIAPYQIVLHQDDLASAIKTIGYPCVLKTTRGGYDGKGQVVLKSVEDIATAMQLLQDNVPCVLEELIDFEREISVIIAGNPQGELTVFPVSENIHRHNILHETIVPARIDDQVANLAKTIGRKIALALNLAGTLCIEMFMTKQGKLYVNELAPRPHNSGHYSIEACNLSQYATHIRGIAGWPLPKVKLLSSAVMVNILGDEFDESQKLIDQKPDWHFHYYGKAEVKTGRKMGHITILTDDTTKTLAEIEQTGVWVLNKKNKKVKNEV